MSQLDGGVGTEVRLWENERTNMMHGRQRTTVRGATAFRTCLELLGFEPPRSKLLGETRVPKRQEIRAQLLTCLGKQMESE